MRRERSKTPIILLIIAAIIIFIGFIAVYDAPLNNEHVELSLDNTFLDK